MASISESSNFIEDLKSFLSFDFCFSKTYLKLFRRKKIMLGNKKVHPIELFSKQNIDFLSSFF